MEIPRLESTGSNFRNRKVSCKKNLKAQDQNCLIWVFQGEVWKNCCHIWNQHPRACQNAKFHVNREKIEFGTKKVLLLNWNLKKLLSYLKSAPLTMSKFKSNLEPYNCLIWAYCHIIIVIFEISTLNFIKNEFLTIMNWDIASVYSKNQGSAL